MTRRARPLARAGARSCSAGRARLEARFEHRPAQRRLSREHQCHPRPPRPCSAARRPPSVRRRRACRLWRSCRSGRHRPRADGSPTRPSFFSIDLISRFSTTAPPIASRRAWTCAFSGGTAIPGGRAGAPGRRTIRPPRSSRSRLATSRASRRAPALAGRSRRRSTEQIDWTTCSARSSLGRSVSERRDYSPSPSGSPLRGCRTTGQRLRSLRKPVAIRPFAP